MMPFALVNRLIEEYNTAGISSVLRSDNILDLQLSGNLLTSDDESASLSNLFGLTKYQQDSLITQDVLPFNFSNAAMLAYQNHEGKWAVVASTDQLQANPTSVASTLATAYSSRSFSDFANPMILSVDDAMKDGSFKTPYTTASKTWRGGNAGMYDTLATLNESVRGYTRSRYWYTKTHDVSSTLARSTKYLGYRNSLTSTAWNVVTGRRTLNQYVRDTMAGTKIGQKLHIKNSGNALEKSTAMSNISLNAAAIINGAAQLSNLACTGLQMVAKAQNLIGSIQNMQFINLASGYLEAVQMVQAGDSDGSAMNSYNDGLVIAESGKNAMQSDMVSALMTGSTIDGDSESMQRVNPENAMVNLDTTQSGNVITNLLRSAASGITDVMSAITTCNTVASGLSVLSTIITVAVGIATYGIGSLVILAISSIVGAVVSAAAEPLVNQLANAIVDWIWDNFASTIAQNVATEWFGEDLGNALVSGANLMIGSGHQIGGGSLASKAKVLDYRKEQDRIIAEEAEYQRSIRSPFDASSQYTFLGSIVYSLIPLATTSTVGTTLKSVSTLMTNSVSKILPTASAIAETNLVQGFGNCPTLEEIGVACDKAGRPYIVSDNTALNDITPAEAIKVTYQKGGITSETPNSDGTFAIVPNSNADRYLRYCGERASNFGTADAGIIEDITTAERENEWWRKIPLVGNIVGDIVDFARGVFDDGTKSGWATGAYCGNTEENACFWESEGKYYQAFFQDQRFLENTGRVAKSSTAIALEKYHESHPLDQSFEGVLARYSGMTKDDVIATLDFIEAMDYLANYNPAERINFLAVADGSFLTIPQAPAVKTTIATSDDCVPSAGGARLAVVVLTTASRGPVRKEPFVTA